MAITIVGVGAVDSLTPFAPTIAGPVLADDIILALVEQASLTSPEVSPSATGFAHVLNSPVGPDTTGTVLSVLWMRAVGGETSVTITGPSNHGVTRTITIRGVKNTGNPWNLNPLSIIDTSAVAATTWASVSPSVADCLVCLGIATGTDTNTAQMGAITTSLSSITTRINDWSTSGTGGGIGLATGFWPTTGATGTSSMNLASGAAKCQIVIALEPATAPTDTRPLQSRRGGYRRNEFASARYGG